jgi:hypothetical protein
LTASERVASRVVKQHIVLPGGGERVFAGLTFALQCLEEWLSAMN